MLQGNINSDELVQAVRTIHKDQPPSSIHPPGPDDIFYLDCHVDLATKTPFILWEDILESFQDVVQVRYKARILHCMKGPDFRTLEPRRIAAIPNAVLDIVLGGPLVTTALTSTGVVQQESPSPTLQRGEVEKTDKEGVISQEVSTTASARRNSADGPEDEAMDKYRNNDDPAFVPIPEELQFIPDTEPPASNTESESTKSTKDLAQLISDANLGDNAAKVALGVRYRGGDGVDQNYQTAMEWYLKAAEKGNADAQTNIGWLYSKGWGVPKDHSQAADWYLKAAEQGHPAAQNNIGSMYDRGEGVPQNYAQAMGWYLKAAEQDHPAAQNNIGSMYRKGKGVPQDCSQAMDWYLKAADQGHASAQNNVAQLYVRGLGVPQDYSQAMQWYLKAAKQGSPYAQYGIGFLYSHGQGVPQDYVRAMSWYLQASNQGHADAHYNIGCMYAAGHGVPRDHSQAAEWYLMAAEQGKADAQYDIGELFEKGEGVPKDTAKAKEWYQKAANQGSSKLKRSLEALEKKDNYIQSQPLEQRSTKKRRNLLPSLGSDSGFHSNGYSASASAGNSSQVLDNYTHVDDRPYFLRGNH
ncbi:hypothetical protein BGX24_007759 [Mortierella sp. AD032]|nr:hypothetical protein BGX24_007759 [Mortierella sp. AD032]